MRTWLCIFVVLVTAPVFVLGPVVKSNAKLHDNNTSATGKERFSVATPPGINSRQIAPLRGKKLAQARLSYEQIQDKLPDVFADSIKKPKNKISDTQRLQIEQLYARGRDFFARKKFGRAQKCFQKALKLAPDSPQILHMQGILAFNLGHSQAGADYLEKSLANGGKNITTFMLLGRFALKKGNWDQAAALFGSALHWYRTLPEAQPYVLAVLHYDLALSLRRSGFISAALEQYHLYLKIPRAQPFGYNRIYVQLVYADKKKALTYETMGDLYHQINEPAKAYQCYRSAVEQEDHTNRNNNLLPRIIYTQLVLGKYHSAVDTALGELQKAYHTNKTLDKDSLLLIQYVSGQLPDKRYFITKITQLYKQAGRPVSLALFIAGQLPERQAIDFLISHINSDSKTDKLFSILIKNYLLPDHIKKAVFITARQMRRAAGNSNDYLHILIDNTNPDRITEITARSANSKDILYPYLLTIEAASQVKQEDLYKASQTYQRALSYKRDFLLARMNLARLQLRLYAPQRAADTLKPLKNSRDFNVIQWRVKAFMAAGEKSQAAQLARGFSFENESVDVVLQQARLFTFAGDYKKAVQVLNHALDKRPRNHKLYGALFKIYDHSLYRDGFLQGYQQLMKKAVLNISASRLLKLQIVKIDVARGQNKKAQSILQDLLSNDSQDIAALRLLISLQEKNSHHDKAVDILNQAIAAHPDNRAIYHLAQQFYLSTSDKVNLVAVSQKLIDAYPDNTENILKTAQFYFRAKAYQDAVDLIESALKKYHQRIYRPQNFVSILWRCLVRLNKSNQVETRIEKIAAAFPKHKTKLYYQLAMFQAAQGQQSQSIKILEKVLKASREYADANNALGYAYARQGRNLARALKLVNRALSQSPGNPAYLDSLGWVLYQQGRYTQALAPFQKITGDMNNPIMLSHYGLILQATGHKTKAIKIWKKALERYRQHYSSSMDQEMVHLDTRLEKYIAKAKNSTAQVQKKSTQ